VAGGGEAPHSPWPLWVVLTALLVSSVAAAFVSEWFIDALTPAIKVLHISEAFAGLVIVAIAGNAVENVVGVRLAAQDKMDYALSIILQSPVQIALALFPILVLFSPVIGGATLTLVLPPLLVVVLALSAVITILVVFDGESNWLEGACLVGLYAVVATAFGGLGRPSAMRWPRRGAVQSSALGATARSTTACRVTPSESAARPTSPSR